MKASHIIRCKDWRDFLKRHDRFFRKQRSDKRRYLFRGQASNVWNLESTLARFARTIGWQQDDLDGLESVLHGEFRVSALPYFRAKPDDRVLQVAARHHGLPSALIDWTRSPYIAAYFAFADSSLDEENAPDSVSIWLLDLAGAADAEDSADGLEVFEPDEFYPVNPRAYEQQAVSVRVGFAVGGVEEYFAEWLWRFDIPTDERFHVLGHLDSMNIDAAMLFRSLDSAATKAKFAARMHQSVVGGTANESGN